MSFFSFFSSPIPRTRTRMIVKSEKTRVDTTLRDHPTNQFDITIKLYANYLLVSPSNKAEETYILQNKTRKYYLQCK